MNQKGFANILVVIGIIMLVGVAGYFAFSKKYPSVNRQPAPLQISKELGSVPVKVGEMTFNERNNDGFDTKYVVSWTSKDLRVTTAGKITGIFETSYAGPPVEYSLFKDVLFVQVRGDYEAGFGDIAHYPLSEVIPLASQQSTEKSARFSLNSSFSIPPLSKNGALRAIWVNLTWVRVYKQGDSYYFHVFAGDAARYHPNIPSLTFNQEPTAISGRFAYYKVLSESSLGGGDFDYHKWIRENIIK